MCRSRALCQLVLFHCCILRCVLFCSGAEAKYIHIHVCVVQGSRPPQLYVSSCSEKCCQKEKCKSLMLKDEPAIANAAVLILEIEQVVNVFSAASDF